MQQPPGNVNHSTSLASSALPVDHTHHRASPRVQPQEASGLRRRRVGPSTPTRPQGSFIGTTVPAGTRRGSIQRSQLRPRLPQRDTLHQRTPNSSILRQSLLNTSHRRPPRVRLPKATILQLGTCSTSHSTSPYNTKPSFLHLFSSPRIGSPCLSTFLSSISRSSPCLISPRGRFPSSPSNPISPNSTQLCSLCPTAQLPQPLLPKWASLTKRRLGRGVGVGLA